MSRDNLVSKSAAGAQTCDSKDECKLVKPSEASDDDDAAVEVEEDYIAESHPAETATDEKQTTPEWSADMIIDRSEDKDLIRTNPMVSIEGGKFFMGTNEAFVQPDGESPLRPVKVDTFHIDKREVSNEEFDAFVKATNYKTEVGDKSVTQN